MKFEDLNTGSIGTNLRAILKMGGMLAVGAGLSDAVGTEAAVDALDKLLVGLGSLGALVGYVMGLVNAVREKYGKK